MSTEREFAKSLAEALGPLYRVTVLGSDGTQEEVFGHLSGNEARRATIRLPGSQRSVLLEVDTAALGTAEHALRSHRLSEPPEALPSGTFTRLDNALDELLALAEARGGRPIAEMSRAEKQSVVRFLDDRGAFALRKAVDAVADALGVSRFTVYNYLDSSREPVTDFE